MKTKPLLMLFGVVLLLLISGLFKAIAPAADTPAAAPVSMPASAANTDASPPARRPQPAHNTASSAAAVEDANAPIQAPDWLPAEAMQTLQRIRQGGPYPYRQDGTVFQNRERRLPQRERGFYREYTVDTPSLRHRGARRIVTGGTPPQEFWYTDDHYRSFRPFECRNCKGGH